MIFKQFRLQCVLRVGLLGTSLALGLTLGFRTDYYVTLGCLAVGIGYQVVALIRYVEHANRDLSQFFQAVQHADFSRTFVADGRGAPFDALQGALNEVLDAFRQTRTETEAHFRYVQTVVEHVGSGLIAFRPDGEVTLINTAAKRLLKTSQVPNIQALNAFSPLLAWTLCQLEPGERTLVTVEGEAMQLAIHATAFRLREQAYTLVSLQNIQSELDDKETEAWQNLMRVLTHEIMNSITPIASLASTVHGLLSSQRPEEQNLDAETQQDLLNAVYTMQKRSEGLMHFVEAYRELSRVPTPHMQRFPVIEMFMPLQQLLRPQLQAAGLELELEVEVEPGDLEVTADPELIEQVLLNLVKNAIDAMTDKRGNRITLNAGLDHAAQVVIQVRDNGPGIANEALDQIFIPFFTTKSKGSGIGLSLSRQIMRLHRGAISVHTEPGVETVFTLTFRG